MDSITAFLTVFALSGLLMLGTSLAPEGEGMDRPADRKAIREHIDEIFQAYMKKDREKVRETHGRDWRGFIRSSRSIVKGIDNYMREADPILESPATLVAYRMIEFDILFRNDIALVSYIADLEWRIENVRSSDTLRVLDVYSKENGRWNQIGSNVTQHPDAQLRDRQQPGKLDQSQRHELLGARESVWRAFFMNDQARLAELVPAETLAINAGGGEWVDSRAVLDTAAQLAKVGSKLIRLEFPRTEIQLFGDVAILYTTYVYEVETGGKRDTQSGRGTEIFVRRNGEWVNPGWHLDSGR